MADLKVMSVVVGGNDLIGYHGQAAYGTNTEGCNYKTLPEAMQWLRRTTEKVLGAPWVTTSERLPEIGVEVLLYVVKSDGEHITPFQCVGWRSSSGWELDAGEDVSDTLEAASHWMLLPGAP